MINELLFDNQFNGTSSFTVIEWGPFRSYVNQRVRHSPEDVFGSKDAAKEFAKEQKFRPPPNIRAGSPYDIAPYTEHCCRVIANKPLDNSLSSRLVRWLLSSKYIEKF